ncbi:MAG: hypothetical protein DRN25_01315 [Thermoplasmata archaeon]|nr:MAG: hypothetical protein DRN25_01315 [Thermoplasmata archaeon]
MVDRHGFIYVYEAIIASVVLLIFSAALFQLVPFQSTSHPINLKNEGYDVVRCLDYEGTLDIAIYSGKWDFLKIRMEQLLPEYVGYKLTIYNESDVIASLSRGNKSGDVVVINYLKASNSNYSSILLCMEVWHE